MKQKTMTFKLFFQKVYDKGHQPTGFVTIEGEFKDRLIRGGYVVRNIERKDVLIANCAKANVPKKEREKMQEQIDKTPNNIVSKPYLSSYKL
ncbi:MAG: hypothetical protein AAB922_00165 [Patescibacteria group bacterium]